MKNYKDIRRKVVLFDFEKKAFFIFMTGVIVCLLTFLGGFSFLKLIIVALVIVGLFFLCKFVLSDEELINSFLDNKLPKKYTEYE